MKKLFTTILGGKTNSPPEKSEPLIKSTLIPEGYTGDDKGFIEWCKHLKDLKIKHLEGQLLELKAAS